MSGDRGQGRDLSKDRGAARVKETSGSRAARPFRQTPAPAPLGDGPGLLSAPRRTGGPALSGGLVTGPRAGRGGAGRSTG